jgi:hypothetical protein
MAADYIVVNRQKQLGNNLVRAAGLLRELRDLVDSINDIGQHCFTGADFSMFEAQFGLNAGTGSNTLTLLGLVNTILNTNTDVTGANRLSQLNEFVDRLNGQ